MVIAQDTTGFVGADDAFEGFDAPELPPVDLDFSVKDSCTANPDVIVDIKEGDKWVRLPITQVELYINKDGPAAITRTAKVEFPAEWGGHSIQQYINGFQAQNQPETGDPYDEARIFMRDQHDDFWQIAHYGYVGGVGPANETGVFKMWVYDAADLMKGIQVSKSFGEPTIATVMDFVLNGEDDTGRPVGVNKRSVFNSIKPYIAGVQEVKLQKEDTSDLGRLRDGEEENSTFTLESIDYPLVGSFQINAADLIDDIFDFLGGTEVTGGVLSGQKRFQLNRHNMVDLMNWFAAEVGGKWHFEPTPNGPILFFDNTSSRGIEAPDGDIARRVFVEEQVMDWTKYDPQGDDGVGPSGFTDKQVYAPVDTLNNDALVDIKPFNTLRLYGELKNPTTATSGPMGGSHPPASSGVYTEIYPYVKLVYKPLLERAGDYEYSAPPIESDKTNLDQARKAAITEFRKHLAEESEGEITLKGEPHILPYDYLRTIPVCNDTFQNVEANPVTYEVNAVKHVRGAGDRYKTSVRASIVFSEDDLDITAEYREA